MTDVLPTPTFPITRFAPSPTWHLHLGHAAAAHHAWAFAERVGAKIRLRIEDIDQTRCRPEFESSIRDDLEWLGLNWSGRVRRQSEHSDEYAKVIEQMNDRGLVYKCFKTRAEIADGLPVGPEGISKGYVGQPLPTSDESERLNKGQPFAWRLSLQAAKAALGEQYDHLSYQEETSNKTILNRADPAPFGDAVLKRKDIPTSYHIACCHDDALQGTTHIMRGEDLRDVTAIHVLLQTLMGWPTPVYSFHPLILGTDGQKLSKRNQDMPLKDYRAAGMTPADIWRMTGLA